MKIGPINADRLFAWSTAGAAAGLLILLAAMFLTLTVSSWDSIQKFGLGFLTSTAWDPVRGDYGALTSIIGTLGSTFVAMVLAVPTAFGIALFLAELCPLIWRPILGTAIELLAAIPSIIYGMWGLFYLAPLVSDHLQPLLKAHLGFVPFFVGPPMGVGMFTAGLVLAIMILPFMASVWRDIFLMTPTNLKESAYGLGATTYEVMRDVVVPYGRRGVFGAFFLGLGRALGETMAVTFVVGNAHHLSWSLFEPSNTIASTLANEFTEATDALHLAALIELGLVLFLVTFVVLGLAEWWVRGLERSEGKRS